LRAALTPDTTKYIFFVADGKGGHAFSETYAEHQKNVKVWRAIEASK
ncbi:MAG: endolytic transglycosylase MltG, partial [Planktomarina sp.]|nr:endolytic transglycosylase MltG [Planktomarina sp.]